MTDEPDNPTGEAPEASKPPETPAPPESADEKKEWDKWYWTQAGQVKRDIDSGADSFDKSMLTLSSGALGVSLAFIKDIVPRGTASWICLLIISWIAFALCIATTVVSFLFSIAAHKKHRELLDKMWTTRKRELAELEPSVWNRLVTFCTRTALTLFLVGLASTMVFVVKNVSSRAENSEGLPAAPSVRDVRNFYMSGTGETRKVVVPRDLTKGRQPAKLVPPPKAPVAPAPAPAQNTPKQ
jgi:hypothetical protein